MRKHARWFSTSVIFHTHGTSWDYVLRNQESSGIYFLQLQGTVVAISEIGHSYKDHQVNYYYRNVVINGGLYHLMLVVQFYTPVELPTLPAEAVGCRSVQKTEP